jgi:hypothetical protein
VGLAAAGRAARLADRDPAATSAALAFPALARRAIGIETLFPASPPAWPSSWDAVAGVLSVGLTGAGESARILRLR